MRCAGSDCHPAVVGLEGELWTSKAWTLPRALGQPGSETTEASDWPGPEATGALVLLTGRPVQHRGQRPVQHRGQRPAPHLSRGRVTPQGTQQTCPEGHPASAATARIHYYTDRSL